MSGTLLLLSGGMDSAALAYLGRPDIALTIDYGQLPIRGELRAASTIASELGIRHEIIRSDLRSLGSGDMAGRPPIAEAPVSEWWPFRNQLLITLGAMFAIANGLSRISIGTVRSDGSHADGRFEFIRAMRTLLKLQEGQLVLDAPAIDLTSIELIRSSQVPTELLAWAHSCHVSDFACGICAGCRKHYETYEHLGYDVY